jgi:NADPH2:quinone reductase
MKTEAIFLVKKGKAENAFEKRELILPELKSTQYLVEVEAFGLNYADVMARLGLYREAPPFPCVIGYEVVGKIISTGSEENKENIGKRVVAFCRFGGYSKHAIVEEFAFVPINEMDAGEALCLSTQWVTAHYMVERAANVQVGDKVLIHAAAGGVGTALIQLCKRKGATVIAKIGNENKKALVEKLGANHTIVYTKTPYDEAINSLLGQDRLDVSFNPVAGSTFKKDWKLLGTGGRAILFGGSELSSKKWGIFSAINFVLKMGRPLPIGLMMRSKSISGVNMLKIADYKPHVLAQCLQEVYTIVTTEKLTPIVGATFTADKIIEAHSLLESGSSSGKICVKW